MSLHISPLERKTVPSFSQSSVPSLPASLTTAESKLSVAQSPPASPVRSSLEVRLYPQPYFQARAQHQAQQLKKIEPPFQSPMKLKPKVVSTVLLRCVHQRFRLLLAENESFMVTSGGTTGRPCRCLYWNRAVASAESTCVQPGALCTAATCWLRTCQRRTFLGDGFVVVELFGFLGLVCFLRRRVPGARGGERCKPVTSNSSSVMTCQAVHARGFSDCVPSACAFLLPGR